MGWLPLAKASGVSFGIALTDKKADASNTSSITYNASGNPSIGAPNGGNRIIVIDVSASVPGSFGTCLVNGVAATLLTSRSSSQAGAAIYYISDSAAGSSLLSAVSVNVSFGANIAQSEIGVHVVTTSTPSQTPSSANQAVFAANTTITQNLNIPAGGGGIGVVSTDNNGQAGVATTWTGMSADYDDDLASTIQASATHTLTTGATVAFTATLNATFQSALLALAGFAP